MAEIATISPEDRVSYNQILDKLIIKSLHLMEENIQQEISVEQRIQDGSYHLAKTRYIMGQNSVTALSLPVDSTNGFSASRVVERSEHHDGKSKLTLEKNESDDAVNPVRWFGVLVPQNLYKAQNLFENALNYVIDCANTKAELDYTLNVIGAIKKLLK